MSKPDHPLLNDDPPPAYHDGRAIERLPAYRPGHLARHHPYGRHTPSLFQRLQLSPSAHTANYSFDPRIDAVVGLPTGLENGAAASPAVIVGEHPNTPIPTSPSGALTGAGVCEDAATNAPSSFLQPDMPATSTSRPAKRKRDEFEGGGDSE